MKPVEKFVEWYDEEMKRSHHSVSTACCLSTIGTDGYPNARIVSLKEVKNGKFIITGPLNSRKGVELEKFPVAALTFWWPESGRQIRIQGDVAFLDNLSSDYYFKHRSESAKILSWISLQGEYLNSRETLRHGFDLFRAGRNNKDIPRPPYWGGISIDPVRIEFFEFMDDRAHIRTLFIKSDQSWFEHLLQP